MAAVANTTVENSDGVNLMPFLKSDREGRPHDELFWRMGQRRALRQGDWKAVRNARSQAGKWELFDLARDQSETTDRARVHTEKLSELIRRWDELNGQMAEPVRW